ncbi:MULTISPECIES: nucleoside triphosphate pyrophosphohydrolase [unclassified Chitinophaga]|uniref:nucleoside triphosphate pyrophosphohydrolase n=1 Tax=unclassified Chitinophaga TaxID=2619133 RepID=UPI0009D24C88|nr:MULTISPECIES: nucleoside triphosphate pyrophosphohydrolase [unclassified Chitinophaga]OMP77254.1 nucleoside triphosphate pyrophosphohydrolase [[Flexibacter] sp. ATCC 35208]WPV66510.1 nucleoside triphosphate pyrophosphohydrolase [Chitinophaga sp. LS1]
MENNAAFERLLSIMDDLREKCPWDRKQTIHTLRQQSIEELYELADAITTSDWKSIKEELGDLLLHIVFYAKIGAEQGQFTMTDVINGICEKLIFRHPHIYGDVKAEDEDAVKQNWEKLKLKEGKTSVLSGVPVSLPALVKAMRLQSKAKTVGFEWDTTEQVWDKVKEEVQELEEVVATGNPDEIEGEFGDVLFSLVNYSRFLKIDAENALERTNKKFISRFQYIEKKAAEKGKSLDEMTLGEMDELWNEAKKC